MQNPNLLPKQIYFAPNTGSKVPRPLLAVCLFGCVLSAEQAVALDVPDGANLYTYLNAATADAHTFSLLGDVTLGSTFTISNDQYLNIIIAGNNHTISRTSQGNIFSVRRPGANLTIQDAVITSSASSGSSNAAVWIDSGNSNVTINLDGTRFIGNRGDGAAHAGGIATRSSGTVVNGNIVFEGNSATGYAAGGASVFDNGASLLFTGDVRFTGNSSTNRSGAASVNPGASMTFNKTVIFEANSADTRAGALWVDNNGTATFKDTVEFNGNHTKIFGGAINVEYGGGRVVFENDVTFTGNYARGNDSAGAHGGAVKIGTGGGTADDPQLQIDGRAEFSGNYAWGEGNRNSYGGAIAMAAVNNPVTDNGNLNDSHIYRAQIEQGVFTDNYAYSESGGGYGGAIFSKNYQAVLSLGSGSEFTGNAATSEGGAIYFNQGVINLNGDVTFEGNRQNASFTSEATSETNPALRPKLVEGSGSANAIYFSSVSNASHTVTLNMTTAAGQTIDFRDPIESAAGRSVIVRHSGEGEVKFSGYNSDVLAQTDIDGGTFSLENGAGYGRADTIATSYFNTTDQSTLRGDSGSTLRASIFTLDGRIESTDGVFFFEGGDLNLSSSSVIALNIFDANNYSSINVGGNALNLNDATLEITATNYVPSQEVSDTFTIVANLAEEPVTFFAQGERITINGAEFAILYNANSIILQQLTVPEPSTYALILAMGCVGFALIRRKRKNGKASLA